LIQISYFSEKFSSPASQVSMPKSLPGSKKKPSESVTHKTSGLALKFIKWGPNTRLTSSTFETQEATFPKMNFKPTTFKKTELVRKLNGRSKSKMSSYVSKLFSSKMAQPREYNKCKSLRDKNGSILTKRQTKDFKFRTKIIKLFMSGFDTDDLTTIYGKVNPRKINKIILTELLRNDNDSFGISCHHPPK
jgi:hypothetical protein